MDDAAQIDVLVWTGWLGHAVQWRRAGVRQSGENMEGWKATAGSSSLEDGKKERFRMRG